MANFNIIYKPRMTTQAEILELQSRFIHFQSPFIWTLPNFHNEKIDEFLISLLKKYRITYEATKFNLECFSAWLLLSFELKDKLGDVVSAIHFVDMCLTHIKLQSQTKGCSQLFASINCALKHLASAVKVKLLLDCKQFTHAREEMKKIIAMSAMTKSEQAGIFGIKAILLTLYGQAGLEEALASAKLACSIDPKQAEWHYLTAYCLGKIRKESGNITQTEIDEIQKACDLNPNEPKYNILFAEILTKCSNTYNSYDSKEKKFQATECGKKAMMKFREVLPKALNSPDLKARIARSLLSFKDKSITDAKLAKNLLENILTHTEDISLTSNVYYDLAVYYNKFEEEPFKAIEYFNKAHALGNYRAFLNLVSLKWAFDVEETLISEIDNAIKRYSKTEQKAQLLVYRGVLCLLHDDWPQGIHSLVQALEADPTATCIENFPGLISNPKISLLEAVTHELRIKLKKQEGNCSIFKIFQLFLEKIIAINQKLFKTPLNERLFMEFKKLHINSKTNLKLLYKTK